MPKQHYNNDINVQLAALRTVTSLAPLFFMVIFDFAIILTIAKEVNIQGFHSFVNVICVTTA